MTLLELAERYENDVVAQIKLIRADWENADEAVRCSEECVCNYEDDINHWEATLKTIQSVILKENEKLSKFKTGLAGENEYGECWIYDDMGRPAVIVLALTGQKNNVIEPPNELQKRADKITEVLNKYMG